MSTMSKLLRTLAIAPLLGLVACAAGPRLQVDASRAEFPFTDATVRVDGQVEIEEWAVARELTVDLPDGRLVRILLQRDRSAFHFAFLGLDEFASREVHPEILFDLWASGGESFDSNDWWFSIGRRLCWQQGGTDERECGRVPAGWEANVLPLSRGQSVEVSITFDALRFGESYDDTIGLAFRFVDSTGAQVAMWPLRGELRRPGTWAPMSLRH